MRKSYLFLCLLLSIVFVLTTPLYVSAATPIITLSPTSGYTGTSVTIQGTNLPVDATSTGYTVTFKWDSVVLTTPSPVVVGRTGSFSTTFSVPSDATVGVHNVTATVFVPLSPLGKPLPITATSQFTVLQRPIIKIFDPVVPIIPIIPLDPIVPIVLVSPTPATSLNPPVIAVLEPPNTLLLATPIDPLIVATPVQTPASTPPPAVITTPAPTPVAPAAPPAANPPSNQSNAAPSNTNITPPVTATPTPSLIVANPLTPAGGQVSLANQNDPTPSAPPDANVNSPSSGIPIIAILAILVVVILLVLVLKKQILG
jgi:hypothetical protein